MPLPYSAVDWSVNVALAGHTQFLGFKSLYMRIKGNCKNSPAQALAASGFLPEPTILILHSLLQTYTPFLSCDGIACHEVDSVSGL